MVRGCGHDCLSRGQSLDVSGCLRSNLTVWKEDMFTVMPGVGIKESEERVSKVDKELQHHAPGYAGCMGLCAGSRALPSLP